MKRRLMDFGGALMEKGQTGKDEVLMCVDRNSEHSGISCGLKFDVKILNFIWVNRIFSNSYSNNEQLDTWLKQHQFPTRSCQRAERVRAGVPKADLDCG